MSAERFPAIAESLRLSGRDGNDRDAFLLDRAVVELLRDLIPDEHDPAQISDFVATLHHAWLFWQTGRRVVALERPRAAAILGAAAGAPSPNGAPEAPPSIYYQLPERLIWAQLTPEESHEPLDGLFITPTAAGRLSVLGIFGVHPARPGFGVAEVGGPRPTSLSRVDGSSPFSPALPGGDAAGLYSITSGDELLELGYRIQGDAA